jgi:hypothetical protein
MGLKVIKTEWYHYNRSQETMKQLTLAAVGFEGYANTTWRTMFLAEMGREVP